MKRILHNTSKPSDTLYYRIYPEVSTVLRKNRAYKGSVLGNEYELMKADHHSIFTIDCLLFAE